MLLWLVKVSAVYYYIIYSSPTHISDVLGCLQEVK